MHSIYCVSISSECKELNEGEHAATVYLTEYMDIFVDKLGPKFEVKSMHNRSDQDSRRRSSVASSLPDDGSGTVEVWRVKSFELEPVQKASHGVFYSGDCYVILYTYEKGRKDRHIIYFWLVSQFSGVDMYGVPVTVSPYWVRGHATPDIVWKM